MGNNKRQQNAATTSDAEENFQRIFAQEKDDMIKQISKHFDLKIQELMGKYEQEINNLKEIINEQNKTIEKLEQKADDAEQYSRRNLVRIFGIKENETENVEQTVIETMKQHLKIEISPGTIDNIHRTGKKVQDKDRPIIVKFTSYKHKLNLILKRKDLRGTGISIQDDLTKERLNLLKQAKVKVGLENAWAVRGNVYIKTANGKKRVLSPADLSLADS